MESNFKKQPAGYYLIFGSLALALMVGLGLTASTALAGPVASQTINAPLQVNSPAATATVCTTNYTIATTAGVMVAGTDMVAGSHCDDCVVPIALPFSINFYETSYITVMASSNGNLQFATSDAELTNTCLPSADFGPTIFAYWDDLNAEACSGCGIYTSTTGASGEQLFYIEYRTWSLDYGRPVNFEVVFYEADPNTFSIIYGQNAGTASVTVGVQASPTGQFTQYVCDGTGGSTAPGTQLNFSQLPCTVATPTVTSTSTVTNTPVPPTSTATEVPPTATNTVTATSTSTQVSPSATVTVCQDSVAICHQTGNGGRHTIVINCNAVPEHLSHGDTIGACARQTPDRGSRLVNGVYQGNYFSAYVLDSHKAGVVSGYSESTFRPYEQIMRDQVSKIIDLAMRRCGR